MRAASSLQGVLFDWDGTLLDSHHADTQAYLEMFRALGIDWGVQELMRHYSPDWHRVYRAARLPRARWEEADRLWERFYRQQKPALLPGARSVVRALARRFTLGLVTSGSRARVHRQLRRFGFLELFAARVCSEDSPRRKPHPAPLLLALAGWAWRRMFVSMSATRRRTWRWRAAPVSARSPCRAPGPRPSGCVRRARMQCCPPSASCRAC
ncbi:MAG: HAD family hydrolase [Acidobacteria bacterium]|nr:HAD family hydrolase [Acidobacteriota bacterium]